MSMQMHSVIMPMVGFGACLRQLLADKRVSASELARMMAYKSRNSIFRILDEEGGHGVRAAFLARLLEEDPLALAPQERAQLEQALEISRVGLTGFLGNRAMRELLMDTDSETADMQWLTAHEVGHMDHSMERLHSMRSVELMIIGCCERKFFEKLREKLFASEIQCSITHYIYTGAEEIVRNISAIQPLLYMGEYTAYAVEPGMFSREREQMYRSNQIFVHATDKQGKQHEQVLLQVDANAFCVMRLRAEQGFSVLRNIILEDKVRLRPIKTNLAAGDSPEDYVAYTEQYRRLEQGRTIYTIKPDVPINFIHPDILLPAVLDGFRETGFLPEAEMEEMVGRFREIHLQRWENFFFKHRVTHTVFTRAQMERFARTGRQGDHFFAMRPYTPEERVRILTHIRDQASSNSSFRIYFFKPEFPAPKMEISLFEGAGTLLTKPNTQYDLAGDHAEALISQEEFCTRYREFYLNDLLERHVLTQEETLAVMNELIEIARNA